MSIEIRNKLEILAGNLVQIPGCEPISSVSDTLASNLRCNSSVISVEDVLALIPGSRIVRVFVSRGHSGTGLFIELPNGPPANAGECPQPCGTDWYGLLKENARSRIEEETPATPECAGFNFSGCQLDFNVLEHPVDPLQRPNGSPLGGL